MTTVTLQPGSTGLDTEITIAAPTANFGARTDFHAGYSTVGNTYKGLIKFDLSSLPDNAIIISATLSLYCTAEDSTSDATVNVRRSLVEWYEGVKNGVAPDAGQDGSTWNLRNANGSVAWASGGAGGGSGTDYASSATDSKSITTTGQFFDFNVKADVQAFLNGSATNHGWWILVDAILATNRKYFASSDSATAAQRPKLVIVYSDPLVANLAGTSTITASLGTYNPSLNLQPSAATSIDTYIRDGAGAASNYGIFTTIAASGDSAAVRKILIKFDLSSLPANAKIQSAKLGLKLQSEASAAVDSGLTIHRSLVQWYEGPSNAVSPPAGQDASTWNFRNNNGSINWSGGIGGAAGSDYASTPTDTQTINGLATYLWDVTADVQAYVDGTTNLGWWIVNPDTTANSNKIFYSSDDTTAINRPFLTVSYQLESTAALSGNSSISATLIGNGNLHASISGTSSLTAQMITNFFSVANIDGTSSLTATLAATGTLRAIIFGDSNVLADIIANEPLFAALTGTSSLTAHLKGAAPLSVAIAGLGILSADLSTPGHIRSHINGTSTVAARGYARAVNVAAVIGCNPVPLFYITDGSVRPNGQLNILNFLNDRAGYFLVSYKPQIAQYKDSGYWSSSPQSQGRRLRDKVFDNVIDVIEVAARAGSQDNLIQYQQDLLAFQEAASDYWTSDYGFLPYYLVARAARETNTRYAIIHMISCAELENPFTAPFLDDAVGAAFTSLTIKIEHGLWTSTPPGRFDCVEISGQREWTVSGWQAGS